MAILSAAKSHLSTGKECCLYSELIYIILSFLEFIKLLSEAPGSLPRTAELTEIALLEIKVHLESTARKKKGGEKNKEEEKDTVPVNNCST